MIQREKSHAGGIGQQLKMLIREKFALVVTLVGFTAMTALAVIFHQNVDELSVRLESLYADALLPLHEAQKMESALGHVNYRALEVLIGFKKENVAARIAARRVEFQTGLDKFEKEVSLANQPARGSIGLSLASLSERPPGTAPFVESCSRDLRG